MRTVTPIEAKTIRKILLTHDARTLFQDCYDPDKLNLTLDHLRGMLMDIGDGAMQARENALEAVGNLILTEDQKMESMRETEPDKVNAQFSYVLGLAKALSMIQGV